MVGLPAVGPLTAALADPAVQPRAIQALVAMWDAAVEPLVLNSKRCYSAAGCSESVRCGYSSSGSTLEAHPVPLEF